MTDLVSLNLRQPPTKEEERATEQRHRETEQRRRLRESGLCKHPRWCGQCLDGDPDQLVGRICTVCGFIEDWSK